MQPKTKINLLAASGAAMLLEALLLQAQRPSYLVSILCMAGCFAIGGAMRLWRREKADIDPGTRVIARARKWRLAGTCFIFGGMVWMLVSPSLLRGFGNDGLLFYLYLASLIFPLLIGFGLRAYADDIEKL